MIKILITGFLASLFLFPIKFPIFGGSNTKMIMAAMGVALLVIDRIRTKTFTISKDFLWISILALAYSLWTYLSTVINHTSDDVFTSYYMSFWVWLGGAYFVVQLIKGVHGEVTVELIGDYLIGVCVFQCAMAFGTLYSPLIKRICDASIDPGALNMFSKGSSRLYGFGAAFDPTGLRMAGVLVIIAFLFCLAYEKNDRLRIALYILSAVIIFIIGNMMARSTTIGAGIGALLVVTYLWKNRSPEVSMSPLMITLLTLLAGAGSFTLLYYFSPGLQQHFRFGFEGFFSLFETGKWQVHSNDVLKSMIVWPTSLKTWFIGDGYCRNPSYDPNFLGEIIGGFYMGTDIGYLRFIFYSGVPGLLMITGVFFLSARSCIRNIEPKYALLFVFILLSNLVGWFKVMSDIIMVFAPFLILAFMKAEEKAKQPLLTNA